MWIRSQNSSWGLSLFVLFEQSEWTTARSDCSWGLSLFVLFELYFIAWRCKDSSWGLSLFVLFELEDGARFCVEVLED